LASQKAPLNLALTSVPTIKYGGGSSFSLTAADFKN
jgi:hypothetical protein